MCLGTEDTGHIFLKTCSKTQNFKYVYLKLVFYFHHAHVSEYNGLYKRFVFVKLISIRLRKRELMSSIKSYVVLQQISGCAAVATTSNTPALSYTLINA